MKAFVTLGTVLCMSAGFTARAQTPGGGGTELYHVQFAKAAPGKLTALIEAELHAPASPGDPEPAVIFRHVQGDDWQLMTISPLGPDTTIRVEQPNPAMQQYISQMRGASMRHGDTFTEGPPWAEARKVLLGDDAPGAVWIVSAFEPLPGHRDQLLEALRQGPNAASSLVLQHREGAPWQVLTITRYASWAALGEAMQQQSSSTAAPQVVADHVAAHHDTIVQRVTAPAR